MTDQQAHARGDDQPAPDAVGAAATATPAITAESSVNDTIARFPATAAVFVQHGPLSEARRGELYLAYRGWTVGEFAARRGADPARLLQQLNAEAEAAAVAAEPRGHQWQTGFARVVIGYTGSYEERDDVDIEEMSVVDAQTARGPE